MKIYFPIIHETVRYNENVLYLLSYLRQHSQIDFTAHYLTPENLIHIDNSEENYILFSTTSIKPHIKLNELIQLLRKTFGKLKCKFVLGGACNYLIQKEDIFKFYPEITHMCVGKGEEVLKAIMADKLPNGVYYAEDFKRVKAYTLTKEFPVDSIVMVNFRDSRCSWNKCLFCHHKTRCVYPSKTAQDVANEVMYYVDEFGYTLFYFFDNHMLPEIFCEFLEILYNKGYHKKNLRFYIFGIRVDCHYEVLKDILSKWPKGTLEGLAWGVEFYDQEILDLYKKGITTEQIDKALNFFPQFGTHNDVYLLFGLPGVTNKHIVSQEAFVKKSYPLVRKYMTSYFLLNNGLIIKDHEEEFKIKETGKYFSLQDFFDYTNDVPAIRTEYMDFVSWDEDLKKYATRDETFFKYLSLYRNYHKIGTSPRLAFLTSRTRQIFRAIRPDLFFG